jgi:hypothetical protein
VSLLKVCHTIICYSFHFDIFNFVVLVVDEMLQAKITITNGELELAAFKNQHEPIMCTPSFGILCKEERSLQFKLAYFAKMGKAAKLTKGCEVLLQLDHDLPLSLLLYVLFSCVHYINVSLYL